jgi:cyclic beta-1,2-glucan synthetase
LKSTKPSVPERIFDLTTDLLLGTTRGKSLGEELPFRAELFSALQMEEHGRVLASSHRLTEKPDGDQLLARLADNEEVIIDACNQLTEAIKLGRQITPAAEWLLDNFYLIEEQIRTATRHLPKDYSKELPRLQQARGESESEVDESGTPRVYDIALEIIAHGDGRVDPDALLRFVAAYQQVTPLTMGELWAIPIMLRLALIENLRRVATRLSLNRSHRNLANRWAESMIATADKEANNLILLVADMARSHPPMEGAFVAELVRCLQGKGPALVLPLTWLAQRLNESGQTIEQVVQSESQQQAADQVSISNSIGSLRFLTAMDWREFVETLSTVEQTLRTDPQQSYAQMDFATRDQYRHVVERLSRYCPLSETEVAQHAIALAGELTHEYLTAHPLNAHAAKHSTNTATSAEYAALRADTNSIQHRPAHVGYYLLGKGRAALEQRIGYREPPLGRFVQMFKRVPLLTYVGSMTLLTLFLSFDLVRHAFEVGVDAWLLVVIAITGFIAISQLSLSLVNWLSTMVSFAHPLPRMDFSKGVPDDCRSLVVVPTMIVNQDNIDSLCEGMEVRFLANRDDNLYFCLLTDFADADNETMALDAELLRYAQRAIEALNQRYKRNPTPVSMLHAHVLTDANAEATTALPQFSNDRFFLLHRPRRWNPVEKIWMGYERKRGKLADLNAFLRGKRHAFSVVVGDTAPLHHIRYVITLDTDTELPRDTARKFIATMAHPLNRPHFDVATRSITEGYGILQPRVAVSLPAAGASRYELLCAGEAGIDPYTRTVSDVYQDLFGEGSFIGKGIYDIDAFEQTMHERMPENRILSHDLLEGCYVRAGLLSDVQLYESYPAHYCADVNRRRRWIRGDWQIASWLLPTVPSGPPSSQADVEYSSEHTRTASPHTQTDRKMNTPSTAQAVMQPTAAVEGVQPTRQPNPLTPLSRWKLLDNLRRSLVPSALMLLFIVGWLAMPSPWIVTMQVVLILILPAVFAFIVDLVRKPVDVRWRQHGFSLWRTTRQHFYLIGLNIVFLPYEAYYTMDAVIRTNWRVLVSGKRLLEWNPSNLDNQQADKNLSFYLRSMWIAPVTALLIAIGLIELKPAALAAAMPLLWAWGLSPLIAYWVSTPVARDIAKLSHEQERFLHRLSRKVWLFFETHVGPQDNWLPVDNIQEEPVPAIAHRTSPTNIGLSLLATVTAYDFGYITAGKFIERTLRTFETMTALERFEGHFYNWYDTQYLKPLQPVYVSAVDSGNLAGHLLTLRPALSELIDKPIVHPQLFEGLRTTYETLCEYLDGVSSSKLTVLESQLDEACAEAAAITGDLRKTFQHLESLLASIEGFQADLQLVRNSQFSQSSTPTTIQTRDVQTNTPTSASDKKSSTKLSEHEQTTHATLTIWVTTLARQCHDAMEELRQLAPWVAHAHFAQWLSEFPHITRNMSLRDLSQLHALLASDIISHSAHRKVAANDGVAGLTDDFAALYQLLSDASTRAKDRIRSIERLAAQATDFAQMDYSFLYDPSTHLLAIGYNVAERRCDTGAYDLLASEARLATFVAIAQGQLPQDSWFALGRQLTIAGSEPILLSWSGSMFEYLMPLLVMPTFDNTLLDQTYRSSVARQIEYGNERKVPWGISESGYNAFDTSLNYQYRAFGVPGMGFKRGLGDDLVIAPYASVMALMVKPEKACENLQTLSQQGIEGQFGFYEAVDYTPSRLPRGQSNAVIRSFMAHHQGMSLLSLAYLLLDRPLQKRFESDPLFQATMSLLHERVPKETATYSNTSELADIRTASANPELQMRILRRPDSRTPEIQLLSNGRYHVMVSSGGGSASRWNDLAVTRWREDSTRDNWGTFCYVKDVQDQRYWSTAFQPTRAVPQSYEVIFSEGRAEFRRSDNQFDMHTEIVVSPEDDIELRRTRIVNRSRLRRTIEITSYAEVVIAPAASDAAHPAFSNLFVQTEILEAQRAILCTRRPRSVEEKCPTMFHLIAAHGAEIDDISYETDRMRFIGRGNTTANPTAMQSKAPLSGSAGSVLDPIVAIRYRITLDPEQALTFDMVTGIADTREHCLDLVRKYQDRNLADRVVELSWTHSQVVLRQLNASEVDAQLYTRLASSVVYVNPLMRADPSILMRNQRGQSGLWSSAISGDLPIVLLQIGDIDNIALVKQLVQAHAYWRSKGLAVDLVIWNEDHHGYRQMLQEQIIGLISSVTGAHTIDRPGGIFVRVMDQVQNEDRILFQSVARVILSDAHGSLADQINRRDLTEVRTPKLTISPSTLYSHKDGIKQKLPAPALAMDNGIGGFSADGREYIITTSANQTTPAPWVNVIANDQFGTVISESGQAYTWSENAHEFRLTPWANDPVSDQSGEAIYLRDEETGHYWSPTPLPRRGEGDGVGNYITRHGFGYSVFEHTEHGIYSELTVFVSIDSAVKYSVLRVRNDSGQPRKISATGYVEWVLGDLRHKSTMHIVSDIDANSNVLTARNPYNTEFGGRTAFFDVDNRNAGFSYSADRHEFIGRNGSLQQPAAMDRTRLSSKTGAGLDPCAALQVQFELMQGQSREITFTLGLVDTRSEEISHFIQRHRAENNASNALDKVHAFWEHSLGSVQIKTPDESLNVLANGWLMYQTLACRMWARSGYYQSGGAFGFRDQLQDGMALVHSQPGLVRAHLLRSAAHQFVEGDAQHWWHPPMDRGVRTHCSDDFLWLPLAVHRYVSVTGDVSVLDEMVHFIDGRPLNKDEDSYYDLPVKSLESASLYVHCTRALEHGLRFGAHGLSLIGSCDWNDGMDKVGSEGKGESVWLSFFLYEVLNKFAEVATLKNDNALRELYHQQAQALRNNIEQNAWDGNWYRRAYFDDGTPLGSAQNEECKIDSISQSWSVISGAGQPERSLSAMNAVNEHLVKRNEQLIQLLNPPFARTDADAEHNPGYVRGYVPGVRENGGQYTHAAIWTTMAFATMGNAERAWECLNMINPINHARTSAEIATYKVEPYVIAADVYAVAPHIGRGGWTWYTGSSGWMYRLITESLLGLHVEGSQLHIRPCLHPDWDEYELSYRFKSTTYHVIVKKVVDGESASMELDGVRQSQDWVVMVDDGLTHELKVWSLPS